MLCDSRVHGMQTAAEAAWHAAYAAQPAASSEMATFTLVRVAEDTHSCSHSKAPAHAICCSHCNASGTKMHMQSVVLMDCTGTLVGPTVSPNKHHPKEQNSHLICSPKTTLAAPTLLFTPQQKSNKTQVCRHPATLLHTSVPCSNVTGGTASKFRH